jgi:hypothetical protein
LDGRRTAIRPPGEDPIARAVGRIGRRQYEHRFGQVEFARDRLHGGAVEAFGVMHHRQRVAGEAARREDIERVEATLHRFLQ